MDFKKKSQKNRFFLYKLFVNDTYKSQAIYGYNTNKKIDMLSSVIILYVKVNKFDAISVYSFLLIIIK